MHFHDGGILSLSQQDLAADIQHRAFHLFKYGPSYLFNASEVKKGEKRSQESVKMVCHRVQLLCELKLVGIAMGLHF